MRPELSSPSPPCRNYYGHCICVCFTAERESKSSYCNPYWASVKAPHTSAFNGPFRKLSHAMLMTSIGGQLNGKKTLSFTFSWRLKTHHTSLIKVATCKKVYKCLEVHVCLTCYSPEYAGLNFIFSTKDFAHF